VNFTEGCGRRRVDLFGACVATAILALAILVFISRLASHVAWEYWLGVALLLAAVPLGYLLLKAPEHHRSSLYYLQIGLMLAYLAVEFVLDYALTIDFRDVPRMVIAYVTLFFAGTGGMIGVASAAGRPWTISSVVLFLVMAALAFVQHAALGT
jgi:hypothetical protein